MRGYLLLFVVLFSIGCTKKETCEIPDEVARIPVDITIDRLEKQFFQIKAVPEMQNFLQQEPLLRDRFLLRDRYPSQELMAQSLLRLATDTSIHKLARQSDERFKDMKDLEQDLEMGFKHVKFYYPSFHVPKVQTFISGLSRDLLVSDSLIVMGLDFFIGKKAAFRPQAPQYILERYEKEKLVPSVMLLVSNKFNKTDFVNQEMLDEMIDYGKSYYFTQKMLPCTPDSLIIWYSSQELADVEYNEGKIWAHFIEKGLLYETSQFIIRKYIGERPNVPEISPRCPGRVATWVGWQIVRAYMENNPDVTLQQLMEEKDARKILDRSKYKPQKK
ncbi:gliding motility lipoprotein GldB [Rufibacter tibetensis]|uniref:Gliding motility lipoprotein GldB n=1 Tax=Rufibacter tibetensis TaxID=512763 RepID=A0A0P0CC50_9BACT|nr:gliding motility lipoprotein GldB [Rufibacter tibetensis]ALI99283.1 gliding motility lipoprotein GldB [Rufibacter tibetensis]